MRCTQRTPTSGSSWFTPLRRARRNPGRVPRHATDAWTVRRAEDEAAWRALGRVPDRHEWLGLPDGGVADVPFDEVVAAVARILDEEDPAVVVTFGPDGIFGHPDHIAIGAATDEAFSRLRSETGPGSSASRTAQSRRPCSNGGTASARARALHLRPDADVPHARIPDEQIRITVDCREVAGRIVAGLREHKSQLHVMSDDPTTPINGSGVCGREWYAIAWPEHEREAPMLTDLFDGLA